MGWFIGAAIDEKIGQTHFNDFVISLCPHIIKPSKLHLDLFLRKEMSAIEKCESLNSFGVIII